MGFVAEPGDPEDSYRISVTCQGVTHYMGALIQGWEVAEAEARALAGVFGGDARVGPIWRNTEGDEEGWRFPVTRPEERREILARALYDSWCEGVLLFKPCFSPYAWEDLKAMAEPDHTPTPEQFYEKADAALASTERTSE